MIFTPTKLAGAFEVDLEPAADERGFFARAFCEREFAAHGLPVRFPQCNISRNARAGTLRGMHYQSGLEEEQEAKLVRAISGVIYDVIIDLRKDSPTRFQSHGVELSAVQGRALFVPGGFAHGFVTLRDGTDVFYQMSDFFQPSRARGFRWNDPRFGIRWPLEPTVVAARDARYPDYDPDAETTGP